MCGVGARAFSSVYVLACLLFRYCLKTNKDFNEINKMFFFIII